MFDLPVAANNLTMPIITTLFVGYVLYIIFVMLPRRKKLRETVHVFLDLETYGTRPDAAVLAIGACAMNLLGEEVGRIKILVDPVDAMEYGTTDKSTRDWWEEQSDEAKALTFNPSEHMELLPALVLFSEWFFAQGAVVGVWGNGQTADCAWLRSAYREMSGLIMRGCPFDFWQERDCRTVRELGLLSGSDDYKFLNPFKGTPHNCVDDAVHQAKYTVDFIRDLI